jgi:4-amino-4-deoxy-L-arabinose transferase-like glycosyltransferase
MPALGRQVPIACLALALVLGGWGRLAGLAAYGFSEDEAAKLIAVDSYRQGRFSANAEHPMLMKLAIWASLAAAGAWNTQASSASRIAPEAALRLPNALAGAATIGAVYAAAALLFSPAVAGAAALFVALDPNVAAINRIGKEDTFLAFFFMAAVALYERAKRVGATDPHRAQRWYAASGVAFGLMLASKYLPHLFGCYALYNVALTRRPGPNKPRPLLYNGLIVAAFLAANFAILFPATWDYCLSYLRGDRTVHQGYLYAGTLYPNSSALLVYGVPATYYFHLIATKVPAAALACAAAGLVPLVTRFRERGHVWLRVLLVFQLLGYSLFAAKFQRYALPLLIVIDMLAAVGLAAALRWVWHRAWSAPVRVMTCAALAAAVLVSSAAAMARSAPYYSVYRNALGAALAPPAATFPEESYDYGLREAVGEIAGAARRGAAIVSDAPMATSRYLGARRPDMEARSLSAGGLRAVGEQWVIVQDARIYFENQAMVRQLREQRRPWRVYRLEGTTVLEVYRLDR